MGRPIDADKLSADMYHEAFEKDSDMQKWDSGCWIRYKMFENVLKAQPSVQPERKAVFNRDIAIEAICDEVMLWFDVSATKAYEIAETAVKRIEVRMEKMEKGEQE